MVAQEKLVSIQEFAALPDDGKRRELVKGVVIEMSPPKAMHGVVAARLAHFLLSYIEAHPIGLVTVETGYILSRDPNTVRAPDVAFLSKARLEQPDLNAYIPMAPDLAVEIVSPNDTAAEVNEKIREYFQAGARLIWIVYPDAQEVYVYQNSSTNVHIVAADGVLDGGDVLLGFKLPLNDVFQGLGESKK